MTDTMVDRYRLLLGTLERQKAELKRLREKCNEQDPEDIDWSKVAKRSKRDRGDEYVKLDFCSFCQGPHGTSGWKWRVGE